MNYDLVESASAVVPSPPNLEALGSFPILQFFGGMMILGIGIWVFSRGQKDKPPAAPPDTHLFLDGPLVQALSTLREIQGSLNRMEQNQSRVAENLVRQTDAHVHAIERNNELLSDLVNETKMQRRR